MTMTEAIQKPTRREQKVARKSQEVLERIAQKYGSGSKPIEIVITGEKAHIQLPTSAFQVLNTILQHMARGEAISIIPSETEISTQQAAEMLNVSRPHVVKLLEQREIPYQKTGTHRRIKLKDLEQFMEKRDKERHKHLEELAKQAQELEMGY